MNEPIDPLLQEALPQRKTIKFASGPVIIREPLLDEYSAYVEVITEDKKDAAKRKEALAVLFAAVIINEDGSPRFTVEQARGLTTVARMLNQIMGAVNELAGAGTVKKG